jgi:hypothetical protein
MPKVKISEYSATANSNTDVASINIDEGCAPSGINNAIRAIMGHLKDFQSGTSNDPFTVGTTGSLTLSYGTANGVAYLNGSKVLTTGSALVFDGTNLGLGGTTNSYGSQTTMTLSGTNVSRIDFRSNSTFTGTILSYQAVTEGLRLQTETGYPITFYPAGAIAATFTTGGNLQLQKNISVGNATPTTSGAGITFPATQSASTNANTLDDYEEGTWTPTFGGSGSDPTGVSYGYQEGTYTKIGNRVFVEFFLSFTTFTGGASSFLIRGLPFTGSGNGDGPMKIENVPLTAGKTYLVGTISASNIAPNQVGSNTTWNNLTVGTEVTSSATVKYFTGSLCYKI